MKVHFSDPDWSCYIKDSPRCGHKNKNSLITHDKSLVTCGLCLRIINGYKKTETPKAKETKNAFIRIRVDVLEFTQNLMSTVDVLTYVIKEELQRLEEDGADIFNSKIEISKTADENYGEAWVDVLAEARVKDSL